MEHRAHNESGDILAAIIVLIFIGIAIHILTQ